MTCLKRTERGVEVEADARCIECIAWVDEKRDVFGLCNNEKSSHFGHAVTFNHPACKARRQMTEDRGQ